MSETETVDHAALGIASHYGPAVCQRIRRLMLEDWQKVGVKLPTYMKLVARFIEAEAVPESWLARLSHQTMDKMLKGTSTPRYEFWACLHLYLDRKYGAVPIADTPPDDIAVIGQALARFGGASEDAAASEMVLDDAATLTMTKEREASYHRIELLRHYQSDQPFADAVIIRSEGAGIIQRARLNAVVRTVSDRQVKSIDIPIPEAGPE